jgi:hypothetical protein
VALQVGALTVAERAERVGGEVVLKPLGIAV